MKRQRQLKPRSTQTHMRSPQQVKRRRRSELLSSRRRSSCCSISHRSSAQRPPRSLTCALKLSASLSRVLIMQQGSCCEPPSWPLILYHYGLWERGWAVSTHSWELQVIMQGFQRLLATLPRKLLSYPSVTTSCISAVRLLCEEAPEKISKLPEEKMYPSSSPPDYVELIVGTLEWGLRHGDLQVRHACSESWHPTIRQTVLPTKGKWLGGGVAHSAAPALHAPTV